MSATNIPFDDWDTEEPQPSVHDPCMATLIQIQDDISQYEISQQVNQTDEVGRNMRYCPRSNAVNPSRYIYPCEDRYLDSNVDPNSHWILKDVKWAEYIEQMPPLNIQSCMQPIDDRQPSPSPNWLIDKELKLADSLENKKHKKEIQRKRQETLLEWFDRSVEKELRKYREISVDGGLSMTLSDSTNTAAALPVLSVLQRLSEASASQKGTCNDLRREPDTELASAVAKLVKAGEMSAFAGAVQAAEDAADAAPPDLVEEAGVAGAKHFQTDLITSEIQQTVRGNTKPIKIVDYVGITKPTTLN